MGKTLEARKSVRLPYFGDDPWFCNTFGLRAEIYVTKGAPGSITRQITSNPARGGWGLPELSMDIVAHSGAYTKRLFQRMRGAVV